MLVSHEVPISLLDQSRHFNDYDYCLVHLLGTHPRYRDYYETATSLYDREVLLDNSIFELGKAFDASSFAAWVDKLNPTSYVIPDSLENAEETVENFKRFTAEYKNLPGLKIGAVQGKNYHEITECYKFMADNADIIAMSFDFSYYQFTGTGNTKLERQCSGRVNLISNLLILNTWSDWKPHHLLGCSLAKEFRMYDKIPNIRSCDTSNPIVAGLQGIKYSSNFGLKIKPSQKLVEYIDAVPNEEQLALINYNISQFRRIVD